MGACSSGSTSSDAWDGAQVNFGRYPAPTNPSLITFQFAIMRHCWYKSVMPVWTEKQKSKLNFGIHQGIWAQRSRRALAKRVSMFSVEPNHNTLQDLHLCTPAQKDEHCAWYPYKYLYTLKQIIGVGCLQPQHHLETVLRCVMCMTWAHRQRSLTASHCAQS